MKIRNVLPAVVFALSVVMTGCGEPGPCTGLSATKVEKQIAKLGGEVEKPARNGFKGECELKKNGTWTYDAD